MRRGPIALNMHAAVEPLIAIVIIAAPWIFGFSDAEDAKIVCIAVGAVMLIAGSMTDWRLSIARVIPLRIHMMTDLALGAVLRLVLRPRQAGSLVVRSRQVDVLMLTGLAVAVGVMAAVTPFPSGGN